jgi:hypothetical protein
MRVESESHHFPDRIEVQMDDQSPKPKPITGRWIDRKGQTQTVKIEFQENPDIYHPTEWTVEKRGQDRKEPAPLTRTEIEALPSLNAQQIANVTFSHMNDNKPMRVFCEKPFLR